MDGAAGSRRLLRDLQRDDGTFAGVLGLLSWLYLGAQVALYAAEVNVVRTRRLWPRALTVLATQQQHRPEQSVDVSFDDPA